MILINKFTRNNFCLDDNKKSSFESNKIILKLKNMKNEPIIDMIESYINWDKQTFEGFAFKYH